MKRRTSRTFRKLLLAAEQTAEILDTVSRYVCKSLEQEVMTPTLTDLQDFTQAVEIDTDVAVLVSVEIDTGKERLRVLPTSDRWKIKEDSDEDTTSWDTSKSWVDIYYHMPCEHFPVIANYFLRTAGEPTESRVEWVHEAWKRASDTERSLRHPLEKIVKAWIEERTAKQITKDYDRKHPAAILKHPIGSSVRDVLPVETSEIAQLREFATPEESEQLWLFESNKSKLILPAIIPLQIAHPTGLKAQTKSGAVSHEIRIFFEALMALEPNQHKADIMFRLGDLITYLYPNGKFNRTNQLPYIINALETLHFYATVPWRDDQGDLRRWRPVHVKTPIDLSAKNDTPVYMSVDMPPDIKQGMLVEKEVVRKLGKKSSPLFNAYLTTAWLWDEYGTHKGKIADPTRPAANRNDDGVIVDSTGKPIYTERGGKTKNLYSPAVVKQLERVPNRNAISRYPILNNEELIYACFPNSTTKQTGQLLSRAKKAWTELEKMGIVRIERLRSGWRIMPSEKHITTYRGVAHVSQRT